MANEVRLIDVQMGENDINAKTVGEFLKMLLLQLWREEECFSGKRPFGNSDWQYQVYASLINAGYEIGKLDEDGYVEQVDYKKANSLIESAIAAVFERPESLRPKGRWERRDDPEFIMGDFECSVCGYLECDVDTNCFAPGVNCLYYCPNCGAKMEE